MPTCATQTGTARNVMRFSDETLVEEEKEDALTLTRPEDDRPLNPSPLGHTRPPRAYIPPRWGYVTDYMASFTPLLRDTQRAMTSTMRPYTRPVPGYVTEYMAAFPSRAKKVYKKKWVKTSDSAEGTLIEGHPLERTGKNFLLSGAGLRRLNLAVSCAIYAVGADQISYPLRAPCHAAFLP